MSVSLCISLGLLCVSMIFAIISYIIECHGTLLLQEADLKSKNFSCTISNFSGINGMVNRIDKTNEAINDFVIAYRLLCGAYGFIFLSVLSVLGQSFISMFQWW